MLWFPALLRCVVSVRVASLEWLAAACEHLTNVAHCLLITQELEPGFSRYLPKLRNLTDLEVVYRVDQPALDGVLRDLTTCLEQMPSIRVCHVQCSKSDVCFDALRALARSNVRSLTTDLVSKPSPELQAMRGLFARSQLRSLVVFADIQQCGLLAVQLRLTV